MKHIDLFSGIGGFAVAAYWSGFKTEVFCENDPYCRQVIKKHWPDRPIISDIRKFDGRRFKEATLLTGGFPCQPFSVAGKRGGTADDRYLWPEMLAVIKDARPRWIIGENVIGIFRMALDTVLADLEGEGYSAIPVIIPAAGLNAPHRRERIWIIANSGCKHGAWAENDREPERQILETQNASMSERPACNDREGIASDSDKRGLQEQRAKQQASRDGQSYEDTPGWEASWYEVAAELCGVDDGLPAKLDGFELSKSAHRRERLKALGNAIVPQIAEVIMRKIYEIESEED